MLLRGFARIGKSRNPASSSRVKKRARSSLPLALLASLFAASALPSSLGMAAEAPLSIPQHDSAQEAKLSASETAERVAEHILAQGIMPVRTTTDLQLEALLVLYDVTGKEKYLDFVRDNVQRRDDAQRLDLVSSIGFELFERTKDREYIGSFEGQAREERKNALRAFDGAISFYQDQYAVIRQDDGDIHLRRDMEPIFIDHLAEYASRMAKTGWLTGDREFYAEAARQIIAFRGALRDPETGLWSHGRGWYGSARDVTTIKWGRAQGWLMRTLVETLTYLPPDSPEFNQVSGILHETAYALLRYQDRQGFWHQVVDHPESYPETSSTGLIAYYYARAIHQGFLPRKPFARASKKAFVALAKHKVSSSGAVYGGVKATPPLPSIERYLLREAPVQDPHAVAAVIFSAAGQLLLDER